MRGHSDKLFVFWLLILAGYLFEFCLSRQVSFVRECEAVCFSLRWMLLLTLLIWCGILIFITRQGRDWFLICVLLIATIFYVFAKTPGHYAFLLLLGIIFSKGARFFLAVKDGKTEMDKFLIGLIALLACASWLHLDISGGYYSGPRWTGLWDNPNIYGMLMGAGIVLAGGLLSQIRSAKRGMGGGSPPSFSHSTALPPSCQETGKVLPRVGNSSYHVLQIFLLLSMLIMWVGVAYSYSRGAWLGTVAGIGYLVWSYGKLKWRYVLGPIVIAAAAVLILWGRTPDSAPWYVKRLDFGRPSAQHRVVAWRGALQMMWDHPFGVGWNNSVAVYENNYSPPENGAAAITTNDYLMIGTQLGMPALVCFVTYVGLCLRKPKRQVTTGLKNGGAKGLLPGRTSAWRRFLFELFPPVKRGDGETLPAHREAASLVTTGAIGEFADEPSAPRMACRAGAVMMLVAFWFDGGLFTLATGAVFWVLLELGVE